MATRTADSLALDIMLAPISARERQRRLTALAKRVRHAIGSECPDCGSEDVEDNGCSGASAEYRCGSCDHRWGNEV